ncbi:uncharacterized protein G2W53_025024 [Senna tora]|uniref:Uncharacterized protein n=1 Tax=Senna tora TaxID=362788 RepID=A0A834TL93_9FABA|nr:uncharacterized protein G2W53_025024 [Senna tora]
MGGRRDARDNDWIWGNRGDGV